MFGRWQTFPQWNGLRGEFEYFSKIVYTQPRTQESLVVGLNFFQSWELLASLPRANTLTLLLRRLFDGIFLALETAEATNFPHVKCVTANYFQHKA